MGGGAVENPNKIIAPGPSVVSELTSAINQNTSAVIERGVKVRLEWGYVLCQMDHTVEVVTGIQETCKVKPKKELQ